MKLVGGLLHLVLFVDLQLFSDWSSTAIWQQYNNVYTQQFRKKVKNKDIAIWMNHHQFHHQFIWCQSMIDINEWINESVNKWTNEPVVRRSAVFIARQHTDARYWYSNFVRLSVSPSVRLSVRPSVRNVPVLDENGLTYRHSFFHHTVAQSF